MVESNPDIPVKELEAERTPIDKGSTEKNEK